MDRADNRGSSFVLPSKRERHRSVSSAQYATNSASSPTEQTTKLSTEQKIELFRSLFRGREDVYAVRREGPNGRHGSPASKRDWSAYNAAKTREDAAATRVLLGYENKQRSSKLRNAGRTLSEARGPRDGSGSFSRAAGAT
jgi:hypothetical protein